MRIQLIAAAFAATVAVPAYAADAVVEDVVVVDNAYNWSGVYVGAQVGYAWGNSEVGLDFQPFATNPDPDGFFGGAYVGYNAQLSNNVVVGIEGDFAFADLNGRSAFPIPSQSAEVDVNWTAAVRGRLGYAMDRFLPYVAAGVAFADVDHEGFVTSGVSAGGGSDTFVGWTVGVGAEYAFTDNLIGRAEYRYTDFGSESYADQPMFGPHAVDLSTNDIRLGIAYKF